MCRCFALMSHNARFSARQLRRRSDGLLNQKAHKMPTAESKQAHKMPKRSLTPPKPIGRPPRGAALVDGQWHATPETIALAVERLMAQRERVRRNRKATRELLRSHRPDLFSRARGRDANNACFGANRHANQQSGAVSKTGLKLVQSEAAAAKRQKLSCRRRQLHRF